MTKIECIFPLLFAIFSFIGVILKIFCLISGVPTHAETSFLILDSICFAIMGVFSLILSIDCFKTLKEEKNKT